MDFDAHATLAQRAGFTAVSARPDPANPPPGLPPFLPGFLSLLPRLAAHDLRARLRLGGGAPPPAPWDHALARAPLPPLKLPVWAFDAGGAWTLASRLA